MNLLPSTIQIKAGDSLPNIAYKVLGDSSMWRELAVFNDIDIFQPIEVGKSIKIPSKDEAERIYKNQVATEITNLNTQVQSTVKEILDSRQIQTITKMLGVNINQQQILKDLDLSSIANSLRKQTNGSGYEPDWSVISWIL